MPCDSLDTLLKTETTLCKVVELYKIKVWNMTNVCRYKVLKELDGGRQLIVSEDNWSCPNAPDDRRAGWVEEQSMLDADRQIKWQIPDNDYEDSIRPVAVIRPEYLLPAFDNSLKKYAPRREHTVIPYSVLRQETVRLCLTLCKR